MENNLERQRQENHEEVGVVRSDNNKVPKSMHRKYHVVIAYDSPKPAQVKSIRQLSAEMIGSLVVMKGIVISTEEVKPKLAVGTFTCDLCGNENYRQVAT